MTLDSRIGLVLEGGGMRGVFTSGVLDFMLDHDINFSYCVGVSAGACNGLSYLSRQRGRAKQTNIDLLDKYQYIGLKHLWTQHSILDQDVIYNKIPNEYLPFDYATCFANPTEFEMVTTSCRTGMPCYLSEHSDKDRLTLIAKASSSLPFVCPIVDVDGEPMLDGGIVDSIPVERAHGNGTHLQCCGADTSAGIPFNRPRHQNATIHLQKLPETPNGAQPPPCILQPPAGTR